MADEDTTIVTDTTTTTDPVVDSGEQITDATPDDSPTPIELGEQVDEAENTLSEPEQDEGKMQVEQKELESQEAQRAERDEKADQLSVISSQSSESSQSAPIESGSVIGELGAETDEQTTDQPATENRQPKTDEPDTDPNAKWYVVHTYSGHENKVATALKQRIEAEHLEHKILDILVPTQEKIEIRGGKKGVVKEKIFPGYILVKMVLEDNTWLAVRTTQGVTSFVGVGNKPTPIPEAEVRTIVKFMTQEATPTFKEVFMVSDTVKIIDGPFAEFIGKVDSVDKERGKVKVLVSIFGRETPVELDFLQVAKL